MANPVRFGQIFRVNTTVPFDQYASSTAGLADGRFIVTWTDSSNTGGDFALKDIRAQIYNADGSVVGGQFRVNATWANNQIEPSVTALPNGGFVVTWWDTTPSGGDMSGAGIRAQVYAANGQKLGAEILVNTKVDGPQEEPVVTTLANGQFVISWTDGHHGNSPTDLTYGDIRAQIFNANGSKAGAEILVNTNPWGYHIDSAITALSGGGFVVTWQDNSRLDPDSSMTAIRAQVFSAAGAKVGAEFAVNTTTTNTQDEPAVTALSGGKFVISWRDHSQLTGDTSGYAVRAQVFNADGSKSGAEFLVNTGTDSHQRDPALAALKDGRFVAVWTDWSETGGVGIAVRGQIFNPDGSKSGTEFRVSGAKFNEQAEPSVSVLLDGRFVVSWTDFTTGGEDVLAQIFDPRTEAVAWTGTALGEQFVGTRFADALNGGSGADRLRGGLGSDRLTGGSGADDFVFGNAAEAKGDRIVDFQRGVDDINLRAFMKGGEFIGARAFTKDEDQVRYVKATGLLQGDVNGDGKADWTLTIANNVTLGAGDFIF